MATPAAPVTGEKETVYRYKLPFVISASAAGTVIEWYDFYLYGVLAAFFATQFFPPGNEVAALLSSLATFGAGFAVRPFGAAFFGRIGDIIGRKFTFLVTITVMGISTALVGPSFQGADRNDSGAPDHSGAATPDRRAVPRPRRSGRRTLGSLSAAQPRSRASGAWRWQPEP